LPLNGWLKIFSSVTRWWWLRSAAMRRPPPVCVVTGYPHGRGQRRPPVPVTRVLSKGTVRSSARRMKGANGIPVG
jgi:hypothetical protein